MSEPETDTPDEDEPTPFQAPESATDTEDGETVTDEPEGPQDGAQPQETPLEPVPATPEQLEAQRNKLARSATTWRNRVSDVLGEDAQFLVACPLCEPDIPGFMFPADIQQPYNDTHARLLDVLREPERPEYRESTTTRRCEPCDGLGKVVTGSRVPGQELLLCPSCRGTGFVPPPGGSPNGPADQDAALVLMGAPEDAPPPADSDPWGSPRLMADGQENPNYGKMPQFKNPALP